MSEPVLHLVLYTSPLSRYSFTALQNCEALLDRLDRANVVFEVCDVSQDPQRADEDSVCFTPTLVRRHPLPRLYVMGELSNVNALATWLAPIGDKPPR